MNKYLQILKVTIDQYFVYRLNFFLWRFRVILNLLLIYFLWSAIYLENREVFGYTQSMMVTYILIISFLSDLVFSSNIHEVGVEIMQGSIINKILKPISFIGYILSREVGDKLVNVICSVIEISILIFILQATLFSPHSSSSTIIAIGMLCIGMMISFFISFSVSMIAFWTSEIWAPRFIYFILVFMLAGNYFPLDILPEWLYKALLFTPFPYFIFIPTQLFLKGPTSLIYVQILIVISWVLISYFFARFLWKKGMKEYSFYGR